MKKLISLFLALAMTVSFAACGGKNTDKTDSQDTTTDSAGSGEIIEAFGKPANEIGVTLVLNTNLGDHAICDLSNQGLQEAAEQYGFNPTVVELGGDVTLQVPTMQEYAEDPDCDIILNMTTSGDLNATEETRQIHLKELRPEMGSYDCGSMNWMHSGLFLNPPAFLEKLGGIMQENNIKPEIEAFDPGMIANAQYYLKKGVLKAPLHFQFCMGCANGIPGTMKNLVFMKETMESLCPGSTWSCFGVGHSALTMLYGAVALGGHIRVGMEDNVMYSKGQLAESNVQFVERARRVIEEFGKQVATPDEAREILSLKK